MTCVRDYDSSIFILFNRRPLFSETHCNHTYTSITPTQPCNEKNDYNIPTVCFFHGHSTTTHWKNTDSKPSGCHRTGTKKLKFKLGMKESYWQENRHKRADFILKQERNGAGERPGDFSKMDLRGFKRGVPYCLGVPWDSIGSAATKSHGQAALERSGYGQATISEMTVISSTNQSKS